MSDHVINGRAFVSVGVSTLGHDVWFTEHYLAAGLDRFTRGGDESADDYAVRLLLAILASGSPEQKDAAGPKPLPYVFLFLGGLLVPEGTEPEAWTPETAQQTAEFMVGITDEQEKHKAFAVLLSLLLSFFPNGPRSLLRSTDSFRRSDAEQRPRSETNAMGVGAS